MSGFREPSFADRQKAALEAKKNIVAKFRAKPGPDDPAVKARAAEREAQAKLRAEAKVVRDAEKAAKKIRDAEAAAAAAVQKELDKQAAIEAEAAMEAERKAARDARYAARKNRKK